MTDKLTKLAIGSLQRERSTRLCYNKLTIDERAILRLLRTCYANVVLESRDKIEGRGEELQVIATWLHISTRKCWLIIYGVMGNGKTTTARAIIRLYTALKRSAKERMSERWKMSDEEAKEMEGISRLTIPEMISALELCSLAVNDYERYQRYKFSLFLIIDDVGIEPLSVMSYGTEYTPLLEVLYYRYDRRMMTILTTNKDFEGLCSIYGERLAERLGELASRVGYKGRSYR